MLQEFETQKEARRLPLWFILVHKSTGLVSVFFLMQFVFSRLVIFKLFYNNILKLMY